MSFVATTHTSTPYVDNSAMDHSDNDDLPKPSSSRPSKKARLSGVRQQRVLVPAPANTPEAVQVYATFVTELIANGFTYSETLVDDGRVNHVYARDFSFVSFGVQKD